MMFTVEVLLKGKPDVVTEAIEHDVTPSGWTDDDVRAVLHLTLGQFDRAQNPSGDQRRTQLRGFSWIVTPLEQGVAITIEIASGAIEAGPFDVEREWLTQAITRVIASERAADPSERVH